MAVSGRLLAVWRKVQTWYHACLRTVCMHSGVLKPFPASFGSLFCERIPGIGCVHALWTAVGIRRYWHTQITLPLQQIYLVLQQILAVWQCMLCSCTKILINGPIFWPLWELYITQGLALFWQAEHCPELCMTWLVKITCDTNTGRTDV